MLVSLGAALLDWMRDRSQVAPRVNFPFMCMTIITIAFVSRSKLMEFVTRLLWLRSFQVDGHTDGALRGAAVAIVDVALKCSGIK